MPQNNHPPQAIQLELFKKTLQGWEPAIPVINSWEWTTEQLEHRFRIPRQELYKIQNTPYPWGSAFLLFLHTRKNKWQVYHLKTLRPGE